MITRTEQPGVNLPVRIVRFAIVGSICFAIQLGIFHGLDRLVHLYWADLIAFILSAQLNFALSHFFTWGDRQHAERLTVRWIKFNASALLSVSAVNALAFWLFVAAGVWAWSAMLLANICSTICTFVLNHFLVFNAEQEPVPDAIPGEGCHADIAHL